MNRNSGNTCRSRIGYFMALSLFLLLPTLASQEEPPLPTDPAAIRTELRALRKKVVHGTKDEKKVRARIDLLMQQLQKLASERDANESKARGDARPSRGGNRGGSHSGKNV